MGKLIFAAVLIVGGLLVGRILASMAAQVRDATRARLPLVAIGRAVQVGGVVLGLLVVVLSSFVVVDAGHIGVVTAFGNVEKEPLYNGLHFVLPYKDVDIQAVHAVMAPNYRLIGEREAESKVARERGEGSALQAARRARRPPSGSAPPPRRNTTRR
jgi:regulator of protease activity HflC (stomatin/prohibitin superfamily)